MTFYEAAPEVLRQSGRPLHFKKITELAIRENLLSHVGKTPEITMSSRLNQEVKREEFSALMQTRPGIFKLKEEIAERLNQEAEERKQLEQEEAERLAKEAEEARQSNGDDDLEDAEEEEEDSLDDDSDDDESDEDNDDSEDYSSNRPRSNRSRRSRRSSRSRRSRRSRSDDANDSEDTSTESSSDEDSDDDEDSSSRHKRSSRGGRKRSRRSRRSRSSRNEDNNNDRQSQDDANDDANDSSPSAPSRSSNASSRSRRSRRSSSNQDNASTDTEQKHLEVGPVRLEGIAQAAYTVLQDFDEITDIEEIATAIFKRKLIKFHTHDPSLTVQSALVNDNQLRMRRGHRELFVRHSNKRWGLSEWGMTVQTLQKEQQILSLSEECRQEALRKLGKTLLKVKTEALEQITLTMLEGLGYRNIKVSKRSSNGDVFFSADWRQGLSDLRVCIQLVGEAGEELKRDVVTELRGTLHHYSAHEGVIIHFGDISKQAIEESREEKLANITLIDRKTFVELLVDQGIGVKRYHTPILVVDNAYIEELTN